MSEESLSDGKKSASNVGPEASVNRREAFKGLAIAAAATVAAGGRASAQPRSAPNSPYRTAYRPHQRADRAHLEKYRMRMAGV